jgi:transposase-like protein
MPQNRLMSETAAAKTMRSEQWRQRIAAFEASGSTVRQFCKENSVAEHSFYAWRRRLQQNGPVRFALVERSVGQQPSAAEASLELVFPTGERLRIGSGVDAGTLRTVVVALRG